MKRRILILIAVLLVSVCTASACGGQGTTDTGSKPESSVQSSAEKNSSTQAPAESSAQSSTEKTESSQSRQTSQIIDQKEFASMSLKDRSKFINDFIEEYLSDDNAKFKADNIYMHGEEGRMLITIQTDLTTLTQEQKDEYTKMLSDEGLINAGIPVELRIVDKNKIIIYDRVYDPYADYETGRDDSSTGDESSSVSSKNSSDSSKTSDNSKTDDNSKRSESSKTSDSSKTGENSKTSDNSKTEENSKTEDNSKTEGSDTQEESQEGYKYSSLEECLSDPTVQSYYASVVGAAASYGGSASVGASGECIYITVSTDKKLSDSQISKIAGTAGMYVDQANYVKGKLTELTGISGISIQLSCYDGTGSCVYSRGY